MIDVRYRSRTCAQAGCTKRPTFNVAGAKGGLYCAAHRQDGMIDVTHKTCARAGWSRRPTFNVRGEKGGLYCAEHRREKWADKNPARRNAGATAQVKQFAKRAKRKKVIATPALVAMEAAAPAAAPPGGDA